MNNFIKRLQDSISVLAGRKVAFTIAEVEASTTAFAELNEELSSLKAQYSTLASVIDRIAKKVKHLRA